MKLLVFIGLWFLCAVLSACIAASKGREWQGRLIGGVLIGPFGLLIGLLPARYKKPVRLPPRLSIVCAIAAAVMSIGAFYALHIAYWGSAVLLFLVTGLLAEIVFLTDSADTEQEPDDPNPPTPPPSLNSRPLV